MNLQRFYLRYYPPGIGICFQNADGTEQTEMIDLLDLTTKYN